MKASLFFLIVTVFLAPSASSQNAQSTSSPRRIVEITVGDTRRAGTESIDFGIQNNTGSILPHNVDLALPAGYPAPSKARMLAVQIRGSVWSNLVTVSTSGAQVTVRPAGNAVSIPTCAIHLNGTREPMKIRVKRCTGSGSGTTCDDPEEDTATPPSSPRPPQDEATGFFSVFMEPGESWPPVGFIALGTARAVVHIDEFSQITNPVHLMAIMTASLNAQGVLAAMTLSPTFQPTVVVYLADVDDGLFYDNDTPQLAPRLSVHGGGGITVIPW